MARPTEPLKIANKTSETGDSKKKDTGKLMWELLPPEGMDELVRVYTIGAGKYSPRGWESGIEYGRIFSAMMRHSFAWLRGEKYDPVDGQHHLASVAWCALALITFEERGVGEDDRPLRHRKV